MILSFSKVSFNLFGIFRLRFKIHDGNAIRLRIKRCIFDKKICGKITVMDQFPNERAFSSTRWHRTKASTDFYGLIPLVGDQSSDALLL